MSDATPDLDRTIWWNGRLVPWSDATVHVLSASLNRGTLAFDVLRVVPAAGGPAVIGLVEHVERFRRSAAGLGMTDVPPTAALVEAILSTVASNPGADVVKISALWDDVVLDVVPHDTAPTVVVVAVAADELGASVSDGPVRLRLGRRPKVHPDLLDPSWKLAASYTVSAIEKLAARAAGFDDVLLLTSDGEVAESPAQSFFLVTGGRLKVPALSKVLDGITRRIVVELADDLDVPVDVGAVPLAALDDADEAFLSSTMGAVRPVAEVEGRTWAAPGPVSERIADAARRLYGGDHPRADRWLTAVPKG